MCQHDWLEKPDYNEKWCPKCNREGMIITRRELLAMLPEQRRAILAKHNPSFVIDHPNWFKGLL